MKICPIFDQTKTIFEHHFGTLVKYDDKLLAMGGEYSATVEEMNQIELSWSEHPMSPVNGFNSTFNGFTAVSMDKSLFIFGKSRKLKNIKKKIFQEGLKHLISTIQTPILRKCSSGMERLG